MGRCGQKPSQTCFSPFLLSSSPLSLFTNHTTHTHTRTHTHTHTLSCQASLTALHSYHKLPLVVATHTDCITWPFRWSRKLLQTITTLYYSKDFGRAVLCHVQEESQVRSWTQVSGVSEGRSSSFSHHLSPGDCIAKWISFSRKHSNMKEFSFTDLEEGAVGLPSASSCGSLLQ